MRIAIVNDMPMALEVLKRAIINTGGHQIAWTARDGGEAIQACAKDPPDLILMDLIMPGIDGVQATRQIMAKNPCPILIVTATVRGNSAKVFEALSAGAFDAVNTPSFGTRQKSERALFAKINLVEALGHEFRREELNGKARPVRMVGDSGHLIAIGASAGGPGALAEVLRALPATLPSSIIIIQHIDEQFAKGLTDWLGTSSKIPIRLARQGDLVKAGEILVAGTNDHLVFTDSRRLGYTPTPMENSYRPSVDVFFESVAKHWRGETTGVLLTGMGRDGAKGLKTLREGGCLTIAQDQATSAVYGMPKAAAAIGAAMEILPLEKIGPRLCDGVLQSR